MGTHMRQSARDEDEPQGKRGGSRMMVKRILAFLVMFLNVLVPAISARPHGNPVVSTPPTLTSFFGPSPSFNFAESFFEDISWPPCLKERPSTSAALKFDVQESSLEYLIKADVPGLSKDDVTIEIERDVFKLSTSLTEECRRLEKDVDEDAMKYIHRERMRQQVESDQIATGHRQRQSK